MAGFYNVTGGDSRFLQAAGFGIAMGNASDHVKAVADWIAPTIDDEGAAVALKRWILDALET